MISFIIRCFLFLIFYAHAVMRMVERQVTYFHTVLQVIITLPFIFLAPNIQPHLITVVPGVVFHTEIIQTVAGPEFVSLLNIDLTSPNLRLGIVQAHDRLISNDETVTSMADRSGAVAGINADYFEIGASGRPIGMLQINNTLWQSPTVYAVLQQTASKQLVMGFEHFAGQVKNGGASAKLWAINHFVEASENKIVLATPALGAPIAIPGDTVAFVQPMPSSPTAFTVKSVQENVTLLPKLIGQSALWGAGKAGSWLAKFLHTGDQITIDGALTPDVGAVNTLGGGPILVMNGKLYDDANTPVPNEANVRYPLTAISISKDSMHILLAVFDGRHVDPTKSPGLFQAEAANYLLTHGAYQAMLFDSGGSSEMVVRFPGQSHVSITNWPSDGVERPVANGLFIYSSPQGSVLQCRSSRSHYNYALGSELCF